MKAAEIRELDQEALTKKLQELNKELFESKQKFFQGELKNHTVIRNVKKDIARIKTIQGEKKTTVIEVKEEKKKDEK